MTKALQWKQDLVNASPNDAEVINRAKYYDIWFKIQKLTVPKDYQLSQPDFNKLSDVGNSGTSFSLLSCLMLHYYKPEMANCFSGDGNFMRIRLTESKEEIINMRKNEDAPYLLNNYPNPFNETTVIKYYLPKTSQKASINILDITGRKLKTYTLSNGYGKIIVNVKELKNGIYLYNMIVDGQIITHKKMAIVK